MRKHEVTINFVKKVHENAKPISAVCHGPWVVSDVGLLDGVKDSSTPYYQKGLDNCWCKMGRYGSSCR